MKFIKLFFELLGKYRILRHDLEKSLELHKLDCRIKYDEHTRDTFYLKNN